MNRICQRQSPSAVSIHKDSKTGNMICTGQCDIHRFHTSPGIQSSHVSKSFLSLILGIRYSNSLC